MDTEKAIAIILAGIFAIGCFSFIYSLNITRKKVKKNEK